MILSVLKFYHGYHENRIIIKLWNVEKINKFLVEEHDLIFHLDYKNVSIHLMFEIHLRKNEF